LREQLRYNHNIIWKTEQVFTSLISGLMGLGFAVIGLSELEKIYKFSLFVGIMFIVCVLSGIGTQVLSSERKYFLIYRYYFNKTLKALGFDKPYKDYGFLYESKWLKSLPNSAEEYVKKWKDKGRVYLAFRNLLRIFLILAIACVAFLFYFWFIQALINNSNKQMR